MIINRRVKLPKVDKDGYYKGYKVVRSNNRSIFEYFLYKIGENKSGRKSITLNALEEVNKVIEKGFHLFLNKRDAIFEKEGRWDYKIIEVFFKKENVVATGYWEKENTEENVVVTKLMVKSLEDISKE